MERRLRVLICEDNPSDADMVVRELRRAEFEPDWICVETEEDYLEQLNADFDIILCDYSMLQFDAPRALELLKERKLNIPFIIISGSMGEDAAVASMRLGAADYLLKDRLTRLGQSVSLAIEASRMRELRKQAEERIREQAEMLDRAHEAIIVRDIRSHIITFWNQGAERLYGWTAAEAIGRHAAMVFADPSRIDGITEKLVATGEWRGELEHVRKDGKKLIVSSHVTLVRDAQGAPKSALVIIIDITEQKKLEAQFLRAQRLECIGTLASGVAHDLNNILAPILMSAPVLRGNLPHGIRDNILDTIETCAQRGADIVRQVLTFARGTEGERLLVQPLHLLKEIMKIAQETFPKSITIRPRYTNDIWTVEGDPTQLHQVLLNLCVNARDAMPDGGELVLSAENVVVDENYAAMIPGAKAGSHVVMKVSDTGTGIPREIIDQVFDPFFTTKEPGKGTGLGLSSAIGIVRSHDGFMNVYSEVSRGSTFEVFLPANVETQAGVVSEEDEQLPHGQGEVVLVVDDEKGIRDVTQSILEMSGYRVLSAVDGTDALAMFAEHIHEIDLVLTDVMMPFMDGVTLIRALRKMRPGICIIASTGRSDDKRAAELAGMSVQFCMLKPYSKKKLLTTVRTALNARAK